MEDFFLEEPMYSEPEQSVKLVLKNNIVMRTMCQSDRTIENIGNDIWDKLDDLERKILVYIGKSNNCYKSRTGTAYKPFGTYSRSKNTEYLYLLLLSVAQYWINIYKDKI